MANPMRKVKVDSKEKVLVIPEIYHFAVQMAAEQKFWNTSHLVRLLVPFLDISSMLNLAADHPITLDLLRQNSSRRRALWSNLLKRTRIGEEAVNDAVGLREGLRKKYGIIWEFFPTWGGVSSIPKLL